MDKADAIFAGGCFWCMVNPFQVIDGVLEVRSGYTGGHVENPTYHQVTGQRTGHLEAVRIVYDPVKVKYATLLKAFWMQIDPTDDEGQFADRGPSYRAAIFFTTEEQREEAEGSKAELDASGRFPAPVVTPVLPAVQFYDAEEYHQDYHEKNKVHYRIYRVGSGRENFIKQHWGDEYWEFMKEQLGKRESDGGGA